MDVLVMTFGYGSEYELVWNEKTKKHEAQP